MAGEGKGNTTDTLSADINALQDRVEKLTDKLNDTKREVSQLRAELGGQDKRLTDTVGRIGDVNTWLGGFAIVVTLMIAVAGVFTYLQAGKRAADEASAWIEKNTGQLRDQIKVLEDEVQFQKGRMDVQTKGFEDYIRKESERVTAMVAGSLDNLSKLPEGDKKALDQAARLIQEAPERQKTAEDWRVLAYDAYTAKRFDETVTYFDNAANSPNASPEQVAKSIYDKGVALGMLDRLKDAIAAYDEVVKRFGGATEIELRIWVAKSLFNKGGALANLGRSEDAIAVYEEVVKRFAGANESVLRETVAKSLFNKGAALAYWGRSEDAIAAYDEVVKRFAGADESVLREQVGWAYVNRGWRRYLTKDDQQYLADTERALELLPLDGIAMCNRAFALFLVGHPREQVMAAYWQTWRVIKDRGQWEKLVLTTLRNHGRTVRPDAAPVPEDLIAAVAALAVNKK